MRSSLFFKFTALYDHKLKISEVKSRNEMKLIYLRRVIMSTEMKQKINTLSYCIVWMNMILSTIKFTHQNYIWHNTSPGLY